MACLLGGVTERQYGSGRALGQPFSGREKPLKINGR
jgi:hypothetical protein